MSSILPHLVGRLVELEQAKPLRERPWPMATTVLSCLQRTVTAVSAPV